MAAPLPAAPPHQVLVLCAHPQLELSRATRQLMDAAFVTGVVLPVDGGYLVN